MQQDLTQGGIGRTLVVFSMPIVAGMLLQTAFTLVDTFFIGMLGYFELAAISIAFPLFFVFIAISSGLDIGANALISQAVGAKDYKTANNFSEHAVFLAAVFGIVTGGLGIVFAPAVFTFLGADATVLPLAMQYAVPIFAGVIFSFLWGISDAILRSQGNSKTSLQNLAIAVVLNAVLDPFLIFGIWPFPRLGLFGAAITTVFADFVAALLNFLYIYGPKSGITLALRDFRPNLNCVKRMIKIGLPTSISQTLSSIGFMALMVFVSVFGPPAIAAYGVGMRINSLAVLPIYGMEVAVASFVGQNIGAKNADRAKKVTLLGAKMSFVFALLGAIAIMLFSEQIMQVFTSDPQVISIGKQYLTVVPLAFLFYGFYFVLQGAFEGAGKTVFDLATNIVYWITAVALAFVLSDIAGLGLLGIWIAIVAAAVIESIAVTVIFCSGIWLKPGKGNLPQDAENIDDFGCRKGTI
ncbi:MAG: MATE family efflux transporter [archaeon]